MIGDVASFRSTVADERLPGHIQTYREYKEALRQQRSGHVYRRDSSAPPSHTPSPDTPPGPAPGHALQAPLPPPEAATCPPGTGLHRWMFLFYGMD